MGHIMENVLVFFRSHRITKIQQQNITLYFFTLFI